MKNTLPSKIVLQKWRNKDFPEKQKLREFITTRPALREMLNQKDTCTPMFIAALFTIAKTWKQPKCPSQLKG